jgi:hypothetical protein
MRPMHSDIVLRWYQGGRNVFSWTNQRGGNITTEVSTGKEGGLQSAIAVPV